MKKRTAAIMVGIIVVLLLSIVIWATYYGSSVGMCGDNISWTLTYDGTLTISGEGETYNYGSRTGENFTTYYGTKEPGWYNDQVKSIVIEDGVTKIGYRIFSGLSNAASVTIPDSVTEIDDKAFENCGFTEIVIPSSVTKISKSAFEGCGDLKEIIVAEDNPNYSSDENGILYNKDKSELILIPEGVCGNLTIPEV